MRKLVTIETIGNIEAIEGADRIEVATVRGWKVIVKKDEFSVDDLCLFHEIDSFLPNEPQYEFLLKGSKLKSIVVDGGIKEGIRLRSVRLRGQISQGLCLPVPADITGDVGDDVSEQLGVVLYEPQRPTIMGGEAKGSFPTFVPKTDEERIQNIPEILEEPWPEDWFYVTEKLDGTSLTVFRHKEEFNVCSRNINLRKGPTVYWEIAKKYDLESILDEGIAIQGEIVGPGIQGNPLKLKERQLFVFNVWDMVTQSYLDYENFILACKRYSLVTVPILDNSFSLNLSLRELLELANGPSVLENVPREGIVIRSKTEHLWNNERLSFKVVSNDYLLKEK